MLAGANHGAFTALIPLETEGSITEWGRMTTAPHSNLLSQVLSQRRVMDEAAVHNVLPTHLTGWHFTIGCFSYRATDNDSPVWSKVS